MLGTGRKKLAILPAAILFAASLPLSSQETTQASIRGIAFDAVRGVPLPNAQVTLTSAANKEEIEIRSGGGGEFSFDHLPAGSYAVSVSHYTAAAADPESQLRSRLIVSLDGQRSIEGLKVSPPASFTIAGTVRNFEDNWPLSDALVEALSVHYVGGARTYMVRSQAVTDDLGQFRIRGLSSGAYYVRVSRPPAATTTSNEKGKPHGPRQVFETVFFPGAKTITEAQPLRVNRAAAAIEIDLRMRQVDAAVVNGHLCAAPDTDPQNMRLGLYQSDGPPQGVGATAVLHIDPRGDFLMPDMTPGSHLLCGSMNELPPLQAACTRLDIAEGAHDRMELCLRPPGNVIGQVRLVSAKGARLPVDQFRIFLSPQEPGPIAFGSGGAYPLSGDGRFSAPSLLPGRYRVGFDRLPGPWFLERVTSAGIDAGPEGVNLAAQTTAPVEIFLSDRGGTVEGEIQGEAVPAATQIVLIPETAHRKNPQRFFSAGVGQTKAYKVDGIAPGSYIAVAVDGLSSQEFLDPEWIARYESQGTPVVIQENGKIRADLKLANSNAQ